MSAREKMVLSALVTARDENEDFAYLSFAGIAKRCEIELYNVRRTVRRLARAGLAEYCRGLVTEDGDMAGSGYRITEAGQAALAGKE